MAKLTERESHIVRWLLSEVDARQAAEPQPEFNPNEWILPAIIAAFVIALVVVGTLAWMGY